jgi:hypothetical protein
MNERIEQLADEAGADIWGDQVMASRHFDIEKFAELIIRECVGVVEGGRFLHDQAPTAIFAKECSGAIKRHFGVTE